MDKGENILLYGEIACTKTKGYTMSLHIEHMTRNHRWLAQNLPCKEN